MVSKPKVESNRKTKSAKEELEEMGEDTDSLITTQSKLRDTIKEATAVASNQFKGFDILDDNGNYKSTYEIMLGIAQIYQEIVDTDKELGRNNANLLLETVAGKTRANIAASIFQSPDVLKAAYESSQNADNSAMRENDKYLESISGHLSQLTNQWQEMWANAANREIINFFIDLGKVLLQVIDLFGVLPSTIIGVVAYLTLIKDASEDKSIIKAIGTWIESLTQLENKTGKVVSKIVSVGSEIKTIFSSAIIPAAMSLGTAVALIGVAANAFGEYQRRIKQELLDGAKKSSEEWQSQKQSLSDYASQYEELKTKLDTGNLSEQETLKVKQQIYDIQKQITEQYGEDANKIDLVNGVLQDQLDIISKISQIEADRTWQSQNYQKGFEIAEEAMTSEGSFAINSFDPDYSTKQNEALSKIIEKYVQSNSVETDELGEIADTYFITGNVQEREKIIRAMIKQIEDLRKHYSNTRGTAEGDAFFEQSQIYLDELTRGLDIIDTINKENKDIWLSGLNVQLNREGKGSTFLDYQSAVSNLESAYASGNTKQIQEAREAYEEAIKAKNEFLKVPENNKYLALFDNINTSIIDTKNKTEDTSKAIKEALQMDKEISRFDEYRQQKKQADEYIQDSLGVVKQVGNVDNTNRPFIFWDSKEAEKQKEALESWGESVDDIIGSYSTAYGGSEEFDGVEIAFTPIINDGTGKGKLLTKETLYKYINTLIDNAGEGWTNEELFALDAKGLTIDGQQISNVLAAIDDSMSNVGLTAEEVGEKMHDWQSQSIGYIANYQNEWKEAIKQGKSFEEYMADQEKDLKDITKATGRYTKEDKRLYQVLKRVIDLDIDRVEAEQAFDENANGSQIYRVALEDLMNALGYTIEDSGLMIDMLVANGIIYGDVSDATLSASDAYNQFSQEVATAIENVSKLNAILTESVSGAGISTQNIDAFKEMFGDDYVYALERSANGYHINAEKLQTLTDKQKALMNADFQNTLDAQYDALKRCNDEIIRANSEQEDTSGLLAQRQGILQRIQDTQDLMMAYQASTSAYQTWINAQSNGNEYDMYDKIASGYNTVKDLIDRGWSGDDTVRSYLDLIYGDSFDAFTASGEECAEMFDNLDKKIEGTSFSIKDFFQMDENGKLTSNGIFNFFDAVKEKQKELDKNWLTLDENGKITDYNFGFGRDREVAEALGMDVELVQSILRAAVSAGFKLNLDQPMWAMEELGEKAVKAQEELGAFNDIDFEELYNNLDDENAYETISGHIDEVYDYIQKIEDSDLSPELKTQQIEQAQDMLSYLVALEREAADRGEIDLKATVVGSAKEELDKLIDETDELPDALKQYNWEEITDKEGLQKARNYIAAEIEGGRIDSSSAEAFLSILDQALYELNLIDEYEANPTFQGNTVGAFNDVKQAREELEKYIADAQQLEKDYDIKFNFAEDENVKKYLSIIYGEGTPEILTSLDIDSSKTPEEIIEMLESGERDVDILLKGDTTQLEEDIEEATDDSSVSVSKDENVTHTETKISKEENYSSTTLDINDDAYNQKLIADKESMEAMSGEGIVINVDANTEPAKEKQAEVLQGNQEIENTPAEAELKADNSQANDATNETSGLLSAFNGTTAWGYIHIDTGDSESTISKIANAIRDIPSYKSTTIETFEKHTPAVNGTAHASGTAFSRGSAYAGGKWALPKNQTALTGELGTEIVVRDGNWFTVGDDGAEFVNLKKGDIVFNHKQSEELLENGYVTSNKGRGHLVGFANGTAYSSGSTSGATRARVKTSSVGSKSSSKSSGGSRGSSGGSGNSGRGGNNSSSKDAKDTKNTLDEVEILIARIERQISNLDKTISNTYTTWSKRNEAIVSNLKNVSAEIKKQEAAYTTYINKANSVGLSATWKNRIQNGAYRIDDVKDSDLWDKINEYKQWYEKAIACKDAVIDLKQKEGELYKQRFDNEQTYYEEVIANTQHAIDLVEAFNDQLSEAGRLGSVLNVRQQIALERKRLTQLTDEYNSLIKQRDNAVKSGKITKGSEAWYEMQQSINDVSESIAEANTNLITFANNIKDISFDRWDKVHDAIGGVVNELEFFYDLLNPDEMFDEQGSITDQGITGFALLAQEYDTYFREVQRFQDEINETNRLMAEAEYDQNLVDKLKELKEGQKQIDYVKKLIEDYEDLLETQKDQTEYAKKVADQQKEINKLEKQYRAIQNDNSEEGATKRQQLRDQINEKRQELQETQEDRRLSETKDMLGDFEEKFEEFLENKLKDIEGIVREVINSTNENRNVIKDTINSVAESYGYTPSDTLKTAIDNMSNNLVSYFNGNFENPHVASIAEGVDAIVKYFLSAQNDSEQVAKNRIMADKIKQTGTHIQIYTDDNGNTKTGYFRDDGSLFEDYTGWAAKDGKTYRFNNGELMQGSQWVTVGGKKYHLDSSGARATGFRSLDGKMYYFDKSGVMQTGLTNINGKQFYFDKEGVQQTGLQTVGGAKYYFNKDGTKATSAWRNVNGDLYYFDDKGKAISGWMKDSKGNWRFFSPKTNKLVKAHWIHNNNITDKPVKGDYYVNNQGIRVVDGKRKTTKGYMTFDANGKWKGYKTGTKGVSRDDLYWTNEGNKPEAIIRKSDGAILTPLSKGDSVIPNSAMKNMYQALTDPAKYLKQYTTPDIKVVQSNTNNSNSQPPIINMQFIANGVQDANKFVNDLMNNKKLEKWVQEITLGQANGNSNYKKYSYAIR